MDFFNQINMLYGTITEFCTEESCAVMSAGPKYEYHWADGHTVKKPIKCSAPKYIDYLMTWAQDQLDDETLFPSKIGLFIYIYCFEQNYKVKSYFMVPLATGHRRAVSHISDNNIWWTCSPHYFILKLNFVSLVI